VPVPVMVCTVGEFEALLANDRDAEVAPLACGVKVTVKVADWPAVRVAGSEMPESTNSLLLRLADETVTDAPLAVRVPLSAELDPSVTLPKLRLVGETAKVPAAVPVPARAMVSGELEAFETTDKLPLTALALVGVKVAVKVTLWLVVSVTGKVNPLMEKTAPVTFACVTVTDDPPVLVSVSDKLVLLPTWTLPNARLERLAVSAPCVTPVPEIGMLRLGFEPVEVMPTLPLAAPLVVGEKSTVKDVLWPAVSVTGNDSPLRLNPLPLAAAAEMVRLVPPVLVSVSDKLVLLPT
jgi:hypothetical protein